MYFTNSVMSKYNRESKYRERARIELENKDSIALAADKGTT